MKLDWTEVNEALDAMCVKYHGCAVMGNVTAKIELLRDLEVSQEDINILATNGRESE